MILKLIFVVLMALVAFGQELNESQKYLLEELSRLVSPLNPLLMDGPASVSNARSKINRNKLPTLEQMKHYNYIASSMYYGYEHEKMTCEYCLKYKDDLSDYEVIPNSMHNTLALVALSETREEIVVGFRGTWNVWNTVLDALLISGKTSESSKVKVHQGISIAVMSLYEDVVQAVRKYREQHPNFKIVITGHSLGGGMATLMYFYLEDKNEFPGATYELYSYGALRVGNKYFADFINSKPITTARVVNRADIFPHIIPTSLAGTKILGDHYIHQQTEYWTKDGIQKFCRRTIYEDPKCSMSMGPLYSILDHFVYFDTNLGTVLGQPLIYAYLPLGLLDPVKDLPPLPEPLQNLFGGLSRGVLGALAPSRG